MHSDIRKSYITKEKTPLLMEPRSDRESFGINDLLEYIDREKKSVLSILHENGAILFRGFGLHGVEDFAKFYSAFTGKEKEDYDYSGGISPRTKLTQGVYTSTEWASYLKISLHNELAYNIDYPRYVMFHCMTPAKQGGITPIANCRMIMKSLGSEILDKFERHGITYKRYYYEKNVRIDMLNKIAKVHKTWMEVFNTSDRDEVEEKCKQKNYNYSWDKYGGVYISNTLPACTLHPDTKEKIWFNQVHTFNAYSRNIGLLGSVLNKIFYPTPKHRVHNATFGNGECIPRVDIMKIHDAFDKNTSYFKWEGGDIMLLDNILTAHGRTAYRGPRKVLAAMSGEVNH